MSISINESFETHSLCIQFWLTVPMTSWWRLSWHRLNRSTVVCPFNFCLLNDLLFVDNDNRIYRILGPCLCTLQYIRLVFQRLTETRHCIPLSNLPNILKCTQTNILYIFWYSSIANGIIVGALLWSKENVIKWLHHSNALAPFHPFVHCLVEHIVVTYYHLSGIVVAQWESFKSTYKCVLLSVHPIKQLRFGMQELDSVYIHSTIIQIRWALYLFELYHFLLCRIFIRYMYIQNRG